MRGALGLALLLGVASPGWAAPASPPVPAPVADSWPCEGHPKEALRAAEIWAPAATAAAQAWQSDPAIARLVADVAPRSVDVAEASARLARFVAGSADPDLVRARLAAGLIETVDAERRAIIAGVRRFNGRQEQIARRIEQGYAAANAASSATAEAGAATEQIQWDTRIFEDRQRMLPLVCRQPAALEARLAALIAALRAPAN